MSALQRNRIIVGDARQVLRRLPRESVDTVVTSPPYFRLRDYQHDGQIGLEHSVDGWVDELRLVARGLRRVLKPTGSLWLNLGDSYSRHPGDGAMPKSLVMAPERLALALVADGWILRNKIVWAKSNPMPTSVRDRLSCTWEIVYCFVRSRRYFYDLDAIRVPHTSERRAARRTGRRETEPEPSHQTAWTVPEAWRGPRTGSHGGLDGIKASGRPGHPLGKNRGDVWTLPTAGYRGAHHAVFPQRLVERPLLAGCPEKVCARCGAPWQRQQHRVVQRQPKLGGLTRSCACGPTGGYRPGIVLDPFIGSGTTAVVAERHSRNWLGIELNPDFAALAQARIAAARSLTTEESQAA